LIHLKTSTVYSRDRDNRRRPIFWQHGSARSKFYGAMRKSRQPRCTAANPDAAVARPSKLLAAIRNFG
jgi:hypothetical protein